MRDEEGRTEGTEAGKRGEQEERWLKEGETKEEEDREGRGKGHY